MICRGCCDMKGEQNGATITIPNIFILSFMSSSRIKDQARFTSFIPFLNDLIQIDRQNRTKKKKTKNIYRVNKLTEQSYDAEKKWQNLHLFTWIVCFRSL